MTVEPSFFAVTALFAASRLAQPSALVVWIVAAFVSVLVHEFGHAIAARAFGVQARISLHSLGGTTSHAPVEGDWSKIVISLAGPIAGFVLGTVALVWSRVDPIEPSTSVLSHAQRDLVWINMGWGALNLLPILPLDGGQVMERFFVRHAPSKGARRARVVSMVTAGGLAILAVLEGWSWAAVLLFWFALSAWRDTAAERARRFDESLAPLLEEANAALAADRPADTLALCREGLTRARGVSTRAELAHLLVHAQLRLGDNAGAVEALGHFPPECPARPFLKGTVLLAAGRYQDALPTLRRALAEVASVEDDRGERQ